MQNLEQDAAFLRLSISDSIIYDCLNVLSNKQNRKKSDIYINNILPLDELDISEKLEILPTFVPARSDEQSKEQLKLVKIIFEKFINNDFDILTQKNRGVVFFSLKNIIQI